MALRLTARDRARPGTPEWTACFWDGYVSSGSMGDGTGDGTGDAMHDGMCI